MNSSVKTHSHTAEILGAGGSFIVVKNTNMVSAKVRL